MSAHPVILKITTKERRKLMAHDLENQNGKTSFASFREPAWHGLGTVFTEEKTTAEMLEAANLNGWNVRLEDMEIPSHLTSDKTYQYVVRTNPTTNTQIDVLGVVGERYHVLQNEDLFSFGDNILDGGGRWETAGAIKGGRVVFGSLALERETVLDPSGVADKVKTYLLINTSHDGSIAIQASITPVRVVCANTLNLALGSRKKKNGIKQSFKIRHTQTANGKVQIARETLGLANAYMDEFDIMAKAMIEKEVSAKDFNDIILAAYPKPEKDSKGSLKKWENKVDVINDIYTGEFNGMIAGSAWGAFNALTERLDWYRSARGGSNESILASASGFDPAINAEKNRLLKVVQNVMQLA
jgi:phage/plasmid-like protein (TIGR03299 family)